ncbi:hypothetical protein QCA50_002967 [Cerrena zonata]|uniref:rRNA-processing protein FYV7 n=1 Tax=Cerrena zonata TaxID=2478898 RepID=A0AAW0GV78_9APHY
MDTQDSAAKKRKPPTFRHLPLNRAKKLKKGWVDAQKIKSQWKAQKRKEGLVTQRAVPPHLSQEGPRIGNSSSRKDPEDQDEPSSSAEEDVDDHDESDTKDDSENETSESEVEKEEPPARTFHSSRGRGRGSRPTVGAKRKHGNEEQEEEKLSLRDLEKQAYSRSSLHTYKSNAPRGSSKPGRGGQRGRGTRGRGRGQPDMRLRMNAMLEKIKRDVV